ncbi:transcriptional regulator, partial [Streptomyces scabiei]|uniref:MmyB family transcriptional regulator n=1 Tax=Streptomyces scabiei TaxID=1930 RepID=UPI0029B9C5FB
SLGGSNFFKRPVPAPPRVQWLLDSMTMASATVQNGRQDVVVDNPLARALFAPLFDSSTTDRRGRANFARYIFLDPGSRHFFVDWEKAAATTTALLRAEAGREPHDRALRDLVGDLSTLSSAFRALWAAHDVRLHHEGIKRLRHPEVGTLELTYHSLSLPLSDRAVHDLTIYTAEPGTTSEDRLKLLTSLAATRPPTTDTTNDPR